MDKLCHHDDVQDVGDFENPNKWMCMDCGKVFNGPPESVDDELEAGGQADILGDIRDILVDMCLALNRIAGIE